MLGDLANVSLEIFEDIYGKIETEKQLANWFRCFTRIDNQILELFIEWGKGDTVLRDKIYELTEDMKWER